MNRVCHLTSVHKHTDTRIFFKECVSMANHGYDVHLVAPNAEEGIIDGVQVHSVPNTSSSRLKRATMVAFKVFRKGVKTKASVYHFHDPELIWVGILLRCMGKKVVFDIHENIREQIKMKEWLPMRNVVSRLYGIVDWIAAKMFYLILAENSYESIYKKLTKRYEIVLNFPDTEKLEAFAPADNQKVQDGIIYVGGVTKPRGIFEIMEALVILKKNNVPFTFHCIGPMDAGIQEILDKDSNYAEVKEHVIFYGALPIYEAFERAKSCVAGISILHPTGNYLNSYSTKIFEYMSVRLPFIVSDFELYSFVKEEGMGLVVDPMDPTSIAKGLMELLGNKEQSKEMGKIGQRLSKEKYSWKAQEAKLLSFYAENIC